MSGLTADANRPCSSDRSQSFIHAVQSGLADIIAGIDELGPQLYHIDLFVTFVRYQVKAIGSGSEAAQAELQDKWHSVQNDTERSANINSALLKQVMEEKLKSSQCTIGSGYEGKGI
ncbi:hypothetical protein BT96DRAFT_992530 [Gymnopus androsaceus JB14]|uniref:Uncharacterized protein n=1 Tax=Gymnopus androsaceus JB14 TaxID=1447944 RepID=A0A6A4HSP2_9AGAR|nr:hypothetical protein BT96DRAFT_992530 [Gymnopus androsaceus JB14]